jgi:hypothetical protein
VILLDVLHYLDYCAQEHLLRRVCDAMKAGGRMLLRVADESSTLRFRCTVAIDRVLMTLRGQRIDRLYCRPVAAWIRTARSARLPRDRYTDERGHAVRQRAALRAV